jgi:hypothetical protein
MSEPQEPRAGNGEPLSRRRPEPPRQFQDNLRRHLLELYARERRPVYLWALVGAYAAAGILLLVVAAVAVGT